jgi:hypothetical protein
MQAESSRSDYSARAERERQVESERGIEKGILASSRFWFQRRRRFLREYRVRSLVELRCLRKLREEQVDAASARKSQALWEKEGEGSLARRF